MGRLVAGRQCVRSHASRRPNDRFYFLRQISVCVSRVVSKVNVWAMSSLLGVTGLGRAFLCLSMRYVSDLLCLPFSSPPFAIDFANIGR